MIRFLLIFFLVCSIPASFAEESNRFVGIWAAGGIAKEGPALFLFSDGKAYFNAMCGKAAGTWKLIDSHNQIVVTLREESTGPFDDFTFQMDSRGWLIRKKSALAASQSAASIASEVLQELEKTKYALPKIE